MGKGGTYPSLCTGERLGLWKQPLCGLGWARGRQGTIRLLFVWESYGILLQLFMEENIWCFWKRLDVGRWGRENSWAFPLVPSTPDLSVARTGPVQSTGENFVWHYVGCLRQRSLKQFQCGFWEWWRRWLCSTWNWHGGAALWSPAVLCTVRCCLYTPAHTLPPPWLKSIFNS